MKAPPALQGVCRHFWSALLLNLRSKQALVYGYVVPIFFLFAFASVFRSEEPVLLHRMGQLVTITILGGACFGLPTGLVAERERGIWRRYRLLPVSISLLLISTLLARIVIVLSAVVLQVLLARLVFATPLPADLLATLVVFAVVVVAFLGLGLLIAGLARDVPAVQAIGQCLFLPMIMIGGVGVPLATLPEWAQRISGFMPGRYSVDLLQRPFTAEPLWEGAGFSVLALLVIGGAALLAGANLFHWDSTVRHTWRDRLWVALALAAWLVVGGLAATTGRLQVKDAPLRLEQITDAHVATITYTDLTEDNELVTRLAPPFTSIEERYRVLPLAEQIRLWPPSQEKDAAQRIRNLLSLAAIADIQADLREADIGRLVYDNLRASHSHAELRKILAWIILAPGVGDVITVSPEFGFKRELKPEAVRQRSVWYAKKYLGRLVGALQEPEPVSPGRPEAGPNR